ncbi:hypothetical protein [Chitinophaga nivalis]|uniref:Bacteriocin n=1 Tax=Chitinophaga nivalis TaxID=2991709 RepID=A0ABT3IK92_9BACT|nr:hypothetical protein [Chitinophaga nivalis]MCW3465932.1 hypothetical protein [Chitinophaga nivalis]MCW3484377.1 hypothetical protein [Chitinophaga nivalis]
MKMKTAISLSRNALKKINGGTSAENVACGTGKCWNPLGGNTCFKIQGCKCTFRLEAAARRCVPQ